MNYSDLVPEIIAKEGDYFFSYCGKCKCERMHFVYYLGANTINHTVKFASICYDCFDKCCDFNDMNKKLQIEDNHQVYWVKYIYPTHLWNEFVLNSLVPSDEIPDDQPNIPKDKFAGF